MQPITLANGKNSFDPTAATSGTFKFNQSNGGWLVIINESPVGLTVTWNNGSDTITVMPYYWRSFAIGSRIQDINWAQEYTLPQGPAPVSLVFGECWGPVEWTMGAAMGPLIRQVNQGNPGVSQSVVNDGNPTITTVLETTQAGASGNNNALITNDGAASFREWTGSVFNVLARWIPNAAAGASNVLLGKAGNFFTEVLGKLKVDGLSSLDGGNITTDGAGKITTTSLFSAAPTGVGGTIPTLYDMNPAGGTVNKHWGLLFNGGDGDILLTNITDNITAIDADPTGIVRLAGAKAVFDANGNLTMLGNLATAGKRGVPIQMARGSDVNVVNTTATTIATFTVPNESPNPMVRCIAVFLVNNGNSNSGVITLKVHYTDPFSGGVVDFFFDVHDTNTPLNGATVLRGAFQVITVPIMVECKPNTAVSISYQNTAAGTINDFVTGIIELL